MRTGAIPPIVPIGAIRPIIHTMEPTTTGITGQLAYPDRASAPLRLRPGPMSRRVHRIHKVVGATEGWRVHVRKSEPTLQATRDQITGFDDTH